MSPARLGGEAVREKITRRRPRHAAERRPDRAGARGAGRIPRQPHGTLPGQPPMAALGAAAWPRGRLGWRAGWPESARRARRRHGRSRLPQGRSSAPEVRMYTGYGMNGTIVKPPYSTLTAYDLNTGTIKWQVPGRRRRPAGGVRRRQGHRLHLAANRDHHDADRVAVPGRRRSARCASTTPTPARCCGRRRCRPGRAGFRRCTRPTGASSSW